ncbi:hypothetical protein pb186bvf_014332 [Paramecium bursaria]
MKFQALKRQEYIIPRIDASSNNKRIKLLFIINKILIILHDQKNFMNTLVSVLLGINIIAQLFQSLIGSTILVLKYLHLRPILINNSDLGVDLEVMTNKMLKIQQIRIVENLDVICLLASSHQKMKGDKRIYLFQVIQMKIVIRDFISLTNNFHTRKMILPFYAIFPYARLKTMMK